MDQTKKAPDALPSSLFLVGLSLLTLFLASMTPAVQQVKLDTDEIIVKINDSGLYRSELVREIGIIHVLAPEAQIGPDDFYMNMVQNKILDLGAAEFGVTNTPEELQEALANGLAGLGQTQDELSSQLVAEGVSWTDFEDWVGTLIIRGKFQNALVTGYPQEQWSELIQTYIFNELNSATIELVDEPALFEILGIQE